MIIVSPTGQRRQRLSYKTRNNKLEPRKAIYDFRLAFWGLFLLLAITLAEKSGPSVPGRLENNSWLHWRGGSARVEMLPQEVAYLQLAQAVQTRLEPDEGPLPEIPKIVKALKSLSASQKAFKGLDGVAHEAYQRTHQGDEIDLATAGRAKRSAYRAGAVADGLGACELCELVDDPMVLDNSTNGTLMGHQVLLNVSDVAKLGDNGVISLLVLYEESYQGGAGVHHGGIEDLTEAQKRRPSRGRLLVVIGDSLSSNLGEIVAVLDEKPRHVRLHGPEIASVQPSLYKAAGDILLALEPLIHSHGNRTAIHFSGWSLSGAVASLASSILDGSLAMPSKPKRKRPKRINTKGKSGEAGTTGNRTFAERPLQGLGKGRTSAITLGAPPCMSANVPSEYIISILYGDDLVCRISPGSFDRFLKRTRRALKHGGLIGKRLNWMTDTLSLATSNLQSHAVGSEGEEARLSIPGNAYLVRPRRLGGQCSMNEIGAQLKGGREALRAAVLWQLNDMLMSRSMWKHHQLDSYIHGLDRVHLRSFDDGEGTAF